MQINDRSIRDFAMQATLKAIEFGNIAKATNGNECAKNVADFFNTMVDELDKKYLSKSEQ